MLGKKNYTEKEVCIPVSNSLLLMCPNVSESRIITRNFRQHFEDIASQQQLGAETDLLN